MQTKFKQVFLLTSEKWDSKIKTIGPNHLKKNGDQKDGQIESFRKIGLEADKANIFRQ